MLKVYLYSIIHTIHTIRTGFERDGVMFQDDFIMREIENLTRFLSRILFQKHKDEFDFLDDDGNLSREGLLKYRLTKMIGDGEINEAENVLFNELDSYYSMDLLQVAFDFYTDLSKLSDQRLEECNFSREEVLDGLKAVGKYGNVEDLMEI